MKQQEVNQPVASNNPDKKFRAGAISATVWTNKGLSKEGEQTTYKTVSIERSYTDKEGKWHNTGTLHVADLPKAAVVLQKAYEYLVYKDQDVFSSEGVI